MKKVKILSCVLAVLVVQSVSWAASVTYDVISPVSLQLTPWTNTLEFQKFDPALGTLYAVDLKLDGYIETNITVTNNVGEPTTGWVRTGLVFDVQDSGSNLVPSILTIYSDQFNVSLAGYGSDSSGTLSKSNSATQYYTSSAVLNAFTGLGTVPLNASNTVFTDAHFINGNFSQQQVTSASLDGQVTYYYTSVPEPATLSLLGMGLVGLLKRRFH